MSFKFCLTSEREFDIIFIFTKKNRIILFKIKEDKFFFLFSLKTNYFLFKEKLKGNSKNKEKNAEKKIRAFKLSIGHHRLRYSMVLSKFYPCFNMKASHFLPEQ